MTDSHAHIRSLLRNYRESAMLIACAELRVFEALANGPLSAEALAKACEANVTSLTRLANSAAAHGLLTKQDDEFAVHPDLRPSLLPGGGSYMGNLVRREGAFYRRWGHLTEAARTGQRPLENKQDEGGGDWVRNFQLALLDVAKQNSPYIVNALAPVFALRKDHRIIDVGGGHGGYAHALARAYGAQAQVFDLPQSATVAETLVPTDLAHLVSVRGGDYRTDALGDGWTMALLFGVLVSTPEPEALALLRSIHHSLVPGGHVVIRGTLLNDDGAGPAETTLFDLHMLLSTDAGGLQTGAEFSRWLHDSGFGPLQQLPILSPEGGTLLVAAKV